MTVERMIKASSTLRDDVESFADSLIKEGSVDAVYNPLAYAWEPHRAYLELAAGGGAKTLLLGMNPGHMEWVRWESLSLQQVLFETS